MNVSFEVRNRPPALLLLLPPSRVVLARSGGSFFARRGGSVDHASEGQGESGNAAVVLCIGATTIPLPIQAPRGGFFLFRGSSNYFRAFFCMYATMDFISCSVGVLMPGQPLFIRMCIR